VGVRDALAFAVPALLVLQVSVVGRLYVSEVALAIALPFVFYESRLTGRMRLPRLPILLLSIWLFAQVETDVFRGSAFADYSRGWSNIAFTIVNFVVLYKLLAMSPRRMRLFAWGLVAGLLVEFFVAPSPYAATDPWKFGLAEPLTLAVVLFASRPRIYRMPLVAPGAIAFMAAANLVLGYRSLAGICFLTSGYTLISTRGHRRAHRIGLPSPGKALVLCACCALAAFGFTKIYQRVARDGLLGAVAQQKYLSQNSSQNSATGLLVGGRPEILADLAAIRDSPFIGHGSWAQGPKYVDLMRAELVRYGYKPNYSALTSQQIPEHSHILGAWVDAGFLGSLFWFWTLGLAATVLSRLYLLRDRLTPLVAFVGLLFLWDVLFSPFGAERRLTVPFFLIILLFSRDRLRGFVRRHRGAPSGDDVDLMIDPEGEKG
jgi:hypothetical protein